jgi:hypothetical protein
MSALPKIFTMDEAADYLRISRRLLQDIIKTKPYYRTAGRRKLFTEGDLTMLVESMPCPESSSSRPVMGRRQITTYAAPTTGSASTALRELLIERKHARRLNG